MIVINAKKNTHTSIHWTIERASNVEISTPTWAKCDLSPLQMRRMPFRSKFFRLIRGMEIPKRADEAHNELAINHKDS